MTQIEPVTYILKCNVKNCDGEADRYENVEIFQELCPESANIISTEARGELPSFWIPLCEKHYIELCEITRAFQIGMLEYNIKNREEIINSINDAK